MGINMVVGKKAIHNSIKETLGYPGDIPDDKFLADWKKRSTHVCKPCWELKYCPYGPFVEQSPLLPSIRSKAKTHNEHIKNILDSGFIGTVKQLSEEEKKEVEEHLLEVKENPIILAKKVAEEQWMKEIKKLAEEEGKNLLEYFQAPTSDFEKSRVPYPLDGEDEKEIVIEGELKEGIEREIARLEEVVKTGVDDQRKPLDPARKKLFESEISEFHESEFPNEIPQVVLDTECKNFGHICPVVFVGESITETTEKRRRGRYIYRFLQSCVL